MRTAKGTTRTAGSSTIGLLDIGGRNSLALVGQADQLSRAPSSPVLKVRASESWSKLTRTLLPVRRASPKSIDNIDFVEFIRRQERNERHCGATCVGARVLLELTCRRVLAEELKPDEWIPSLDLE
jgi:hypothetical protein